MGNSQIEYQLTWHLLKATVWCANWSGGINGPYFIEKEDVTLTVNGERFCVKIENFLTPHLHALDLISMLYQQDVATSYTAWITMELQRDIFP